MTFGLLLILNTKLYASIS